MLSRDNKEENQFILTKSHNIPYVLHCYANITIKIDIFKNNKFDENDRKS